MQAVRGGPTEGVGSVIEHVLEAKPGARPGASTRVRSSVDNPGPLAQKGRKLCPAPSGRVAARCVGSGGPPEFTMMSDPERSNASRPQAGARRLATLGLVGGALLSLPAIGAPACIPGALWPDTDGVHINAHGGGLLYQEGTYYWFGEHKVAGEAGNLAEVGVRVYSSRDLQRWRNEGVALAVEEDPASEIARGCIIERPKVIACTATGRYVMWFHLEPKGSGYRGARSGVAVADRVTGPYRYTGSFRPNAGVWPLNAPESLRKPLDAAEAAHLSALNLRGGPVPGYPTDVIFRRDFEGGQMARDMTLFVDDDRTAYHIYASEENGTLHISQLTEDYERPAGRYVRVMPGRFHEAPAVFKRDGRYWMIASGCTGWLPNEARLLSAESIWGPWKELGNPWRGPEEMTAISFNTQSTFVFPVPGRKDAWIFMADRWQPENAIDGRYVWLPLRFEEDGTPYLEWLDRWDLAAFAE